MYLSVQPGWPERSRRLSAHNPIPSIRNCFQVQRLCRRQARPEGQNSRWAQGFRPCALGLLSLAVLVVLWGTGSKLTLYHHSHNASQTSFIGKMWFEPRAANLVPAIHRLRSHSGSHDETGKTRRSAQHAPLIHSAAVPIFSLFTSSFASFAFLLPFRSPPAL